MTEAIPASQIETPPAEPRAEWRSRITGHGEVAPDQLLANPRNWRIHPKRQQDAVTEALDQVGWVQDVIVNTTTGHVVDGHLRVGLAMSRGEETIPVSYVELTEEEELLVLATLDPLAAMAATDEGVLRDLVADLENYLGGELDQMVSELVVPDAPGDDAPWSPGDPVIHYDIIFDSEEQQRAWQGLLRHLVATHDGETIGERLHDFIVAGGWYEPPA